MQKTKPRLAIFYGGDEASHDLSLETGMWLCHYAPRSIFEVVPIHVTPDNKWQVPSGALPARGSVVSMLESFRAGLLKLSPAQGLQRLLQKPIRAFVNTIRGKGGDDGSLHGLGSSLDIVTAGSNAQTCQQTSHKHICAQRTDDIAQTPFTLLFAKNTLPADAIAQIKEYLLPPLFVKPVAQESSIGVARVETTDDLAAAISRAQLYGEIMVQEASRGQELTITLVEDRKGHVVSLPPCVITPHRAAFYNADAKRRYGQISARPESAEKSLLVREAETVARDVWERLDCRGYASFDFIVSDDQVDLLDVNVTPVFSAVSPLKQQFTAAGLHPTTFIDNFIRTSFKP